ncbi:MAG: MFS transporter [Candidatus Nanoarchaeia archaeon]|nr:MFS transporter [Candidatus Nanoarchaeia archaeon]MDD5053901.1 MFS transporter [Candidatus Nanoarchaeia archaeon]MDD5499716.1 MFS transporter [Candidatus Nanoarchaeia archaeon]
MSFKNIRFFSYFKNVNPKIRILLFTNSLVLLASYMLGPIYALFVVDIGGDILDAGLTVSIYALAAAITTIISGVYADKIKENELIIVLGYLMLGLGFFLFIFVNNILMLFAVQAFIGMGEAIYSPANNAIYSKHLSKGNAGKDWSLWEVMSYLTYIVGATVGAYLVKNFGFDMLFLLLSGLCVFSASYIYFLPRKAL